MNGKTIGVIVLIAAVLLVIIGIRGTQNAIFPFLPSFGSSTPPKETGQLGTTGHKTKSGCTYSCPGFGYVLVTHQDGTVDCTNPLRGHTTVNPIEKCQ